MLRKGSEISKKYTFLSIATKFREMKFCLDSLLVQISMRKGADFNVSVGNQILSKFVEMFTKGSRKKNLAVHLRP